MVSKEQFIEELPGEDGWWIEDSKIYYESLYDRLLEFLSHIEIQDILNQAYWSAANQYQ